MIPVSTSTVTPVSYLLSPVVRRPPKLPSVTPSTRDDGHRGVLGTTTVGPTPPLRPVRGPIGPRVRHHTLTPPRQIPPSATGVVHTGVVDPRSKGSVDTCRRGVVPVREGETLVLEDLRVCRDTPPTTVYSGPQPLQVRNDSPTTTPSDLGQIPSGPTGSGRSWDWSQRREGHTTPNPHLLYPKDPVREGAVHTDRTKVGSPKDV